MYLDAKRTTEGKGIQNKVQLVQKSTVKLAEAKPILPLSKIK